MSSSMTYSSLVEDIIGYTQRKDSAFAAEIPRFVMLSENILATELKLLGFQNVVSGVLPTTNNTLPKPALWRDNISFNYIDSSGNRVEILPRSYEYCRNYWPNQSLTGAPRFYADYNFDNFLIVPTPSSAFQFELLYHSKLHPLDDSNQTNWLTNNAPQLLLSQCLIQAYIWARNDIELQKWQMSYDKAIAAFNGENTSRISDRTTEVK